LNYNTEVKPDLAWSSGMENNMNIAKIFHNWLTWASVQSNPKLNVTYLDWKNAAVLIDIKRLDVIGRYFPTFNSLAWLFTTCIQLVCVEKTQYKHIFWLDYWLYLKLHFTELLQKINSATLNFSTFFESLLNWK